MREQQQPSVRPPSYSRLWVDMIETFRRERPLLLGLAGFFLLLPTVAQLVFLPMPDMKDGENAFVQLMAFYDRNKLELFLLFFWVSFGELAITILLLAPDRPTVGTALARAARLFGWHALQRVTVLAIVMGGLLMFIVPALYVSARLSLCTPILAREEARTPFDLIRRSLALTRGMGWHVGAFILLLWLGTNLFAAAVSSVAIALFQPLGDGAVVRVASALIQGAAAVPATLLAALFTVSLWRAVRA